MIPLTGWSYCKKITVQTAYLDAALTDFPLVVFIDGDTDIGAHALSTGYDIRFTASDGTTLLSYERRSFAIVAGAATGRFVVKTSLAMSPATDIYVHYGKAGAADGADAVNAYDASFKRIWPLNEAYSTAAENYKDSKGVGNLTLTDVDGDSAQGTGPIDKAVNLNGDADYLTDVDHADHDPGGAMTIEAWINSNSDGNWASIVDHDNSGDGIPKWGLITRSSGLPLTSKCAFRGKTASGVFYAQGTADYKGAGWMYFAGIFDRTLLSQRAKVYKNGVVDTTDNSYNEDIMAAANGINIGSRLPYSGTYYTGLLAEVRYSVIARSVAWIKFTYRNITEADHEQTWGAEESAMPPFVGNIFVGKKISGIR